MKILIFLILSTSSWAYQDVSCWEQSCLENGWTRMNPINKTFTDYMCYRSGCASSGMIVGGSQGVRFYTQCKEAGCFVEGWYEIDRDTQALIADVSCQQKDCFIHGWISSTAFGPTITKCLNQNCQQEGWSSQQPGGGFVHSYCKNKSCFREGWIESR